MKIAVIAPSPVPFIIGGAEKLFSGMVNCINNHTSHVCELIKIPSREDNFWNLIDTYYRFYTLDVSYFDLIITAKYPAWMVRHKNHHIYMLHCLRGLYETYRYFTHLSLTCDIQHNKIEHIYSLIEQNSDLDTFFSNLFLLRDDPTIPNEAFIFPGPFIRDIIHFLDQKAFAEIRSYSAISNTVAQRKEYFFPGAQVNVIYPPSNLLNFKNKSRQYFFTVSRLDAPKRIDMIIQAYQSVKTKIPLKIAGTGPMKETLLQLAEGDPQIEFLGFINDAQLEEYYANAYAVIFIPNDEDLGLVTLEAMNCKKPVLTFTDSGGVTEFVENGITGYQCKPDITALAEQINKIASNKKQCRKMGENAWHKVSHITWKTCIEKLLTIIITRKPLLQITLLSTYPVFPPQGGGQNRIYYLYKELAKYIKVDIIALCHESEAYTENEIAPNLWEIRVPKTQQHALTEWQTMEKHAGIPVTDIAMLDLYNETPQYIEKIKKSILNAQLIICSHMYTYNLLKSLNIDILFIHDSQNVEYLLKKQMLPHSDFNTQLINKVFEAEKAMCREAWLNITCSQTDADDFSKLYEINNMIVIPNGFDIKSVFFFSEKERKQFKISVGCENQKIVLFIGSWHQPNIEAVYEIIKIASKMPQYKFIILGNVCGAFSEMTEKPHNMAFAGIVSESEKLFYYKIADIAINPMITGSGTNLKMLDYMASGIPVITTETGSRGLNLPKNIVLITNNLSKFPYYIKKIKKYTNTKKARIFVEENYSWEGIALNYLNQLKKKYSEYNIKS